MPSRVVSRRGGCGGAGDHRPGGVLGSALVLVSVALGACHGATSEVRFTCTVEEEGETGGVEVAVAADVTWTCEELCEESVNLYEGVEAWCEGASFEVPPKRECDCTLQVAPACERWMRRRGCND